MAAAVCLAEDHLAAYDSAMSEATEHVAIPDDALRDLGIISELAEKLPVIARDSDLLRRAANRSAAARIISELAQLDLERAQTLLYALLATQTFHRRLGGAPAETVDALTKTLQHAPESWRRQHHDGWLLASKHLPDVLDVGHPLATLTKAVELGYNYQNLLTGARVITDVRPVFDDRASRVDRAVVAFSIAIEYLSAGTEQRIDLAADVTDIRRLHQLLERALKKSAIIQSDLDERWPTCVVGDDGGSS